MNAGGKGQGGEKEKARIKIRACGVCGLRAQGVAQAGGFEKWVHTACDCTRRSSRGHEEPAGALTGRAALDPAQASHATKISLDGARKIGRCVEQGHHGRMLKAHVPKNDGHGGACGPRARGEAHLSSAAVVLCCSLFTQIYSGSFTLCCNLSFGVKGGGSRLAAGPFCLRRVPPSSAQQERYEERVREKRERAEFRERKESARRSSAARPSLRRSPRS